MATQLDVVVVIGFSLLCYNLLDDGAVAIALERISQKFKNGSVGTKTTESIEAIVDRKLEHHLF